MPFDALTRIDVVPSLLTRIGLAPISMDVVNPHKRRAEKAALDILTETVGPHVAHARVIHAGAWIEHNTNRYLQLSPSRPLSLWGRCRRMLGKALEFTPQLTHAPEMLVLSERVLSTVSMTSRVYEGIPVPAMNLATTVQHRLADQGVRAHFATESFYTDPILYLNLPNGERYCLAIWDYDRYGFPVIEHLATLT